MDGRLWRQTRLERLLLGVGCFLLGAVTSEEYRRWGRRLVCERLGIEELIV